MKTKKFLDLLGFVILGSIVTLVIDRLTGCSHGDVGWMASSIHQVSYMLWGAAIGVTVRRLYG